jgi:hypothetical protein
MEVLKMDLNKVFEELKKTKSKNNVKKDKLLEKILAIRNPMDFTNDIATDEEIDELIDYMEELDSEKAEILKAKEYIIKTKADKSKDSNFV